jgi:hypothetical protein
VVIVGGVAVTIQQAEEALEVLRASSGMMVRQPLQRAGSPLAACDYHAASAPFRQRPADVAARGRGAAGRHLTKPAFVLAVESLLAEERSREQRAAELESAVARLAVPVPREQVEEALAAFTADHSYAVTIAGAAVAVLRKRHVAVLRSSLRLAAREAVTACERSSGEFRCAAAAPCGTGDCRLARGVLTGLAIPEEAAGPRSMTLSRPPNHVAAGTRFSPDGMLLSLLERRPWRAARLAG